MDGARKDASWTFHDILIVSIILLFSYIAFMLALTITGFLKYSVQLYMTSYFIYLTMLFLPIAWVKRRYGLKVSVLGLKKGEWGIARQISIGVLCGCVYFVIFSLLSHAGPKIGRLHHEHIIYIMTFPITAFGFSLVVLGPIGQELFFRGFVYKYFEKRFGGLSGLIIQAAIFTAAHIFEPYQSQSQIVLLLVSSFLTGLILGGLYRMSDSLYPSIIFHGTYNYLVAIAIFAERIGPRG